MGGDQKKKKKKSGRKRKEVRQNLNKKEEKRGAGGSKKPSIHYVRGRQRGRPKEEKNLGKKSGTEVGGACPDNFPPRGKEDPLENRKKKTRTSFSI